MVQGLTTEFAQMMDSSHTRRKVALPPIVAIVAMMTLSLLPAMPYGFYSMMRWVVCGCALWTALIAFRAKNEGWAITWLITAGLFNPIFPTHASRELWAFANVATIVSAFLFARSFVFDRGKEHE